MKCTFFSFCLILMGAFASYAAEWDLFPPNQKTFYWDNNLNGKKNVSVYRMDSISLNAAGSTLYFNRNLEINGAGACYAEHLALINNQGPLTEIDSLQRMGDTIFYWSSISNTPFYFLPKATTGQSWTVESTYGGNRYDEITITCTSVEKATYLGFTDSVKTFSMLANGTSNGQIPVSDFEIRLSKHHGLIEFIPFRLFLFHPAHVDFWSLKQLGLDSAGIQIGYQQPQFEDYFHLSVGDVLSWHRDIDPANIWYNPFVDIYHRDSITDVIDLPDTLIYVYDRSTLQDDGSIVYTFGNKVQYSKQVFGNLLNAPPTSVGFGNNQFGTSYSQDRVLIWESDFLLLDTDHFTGDSVSSYAFSTYANTIDTNNCHVNFGIDLFYYFGLNTYAGVTRHCRNNFGTDCTTLIGSKVNGVVSGNLHLPTGIRTTSLEDMDFQVYPNPARDFLMIDIPKGMHQYNYIISDMSGKAIQLGALSGNSIDIADLETGFYHISVEAESAVYNACFVKCSAGN